MTTKVLFSNNKRSRFVLLSGIAVALFWITANIFDVYHLAAVGAIYEIMWMPAVFITIAIQVFAFVFWAKEKFSIRSLYLYTILIVVAAVALVQLKLRFL